MLQENLNTIALLGEESLKVSNLMEVLMGKDLEKVDKIRETELDCSKLVYNLHLKNNNFTIQKINLQDKVENSLKVYYNTDILIVYFTLETNKKIDSLLKTHMFMANVFGVTNVIVVLDSRNITETKDYLEIQKKIQEAFTKRNFKITQINFIEYRGNNSVLHENLLHYLQPKKSKKKEKTTELIISIDNVFRIDKTHVGINGKINRGTLSQNQTIKISPINEIYKVLEIQCAHKTIPKAVKGQQIGFMIKTSNKFIEEGMIISEMNYNIDPVKQATLQLVNLNKESIKLDNEYVFISHNTEFIGRIIGISIKNTEKTRKNVSSLESGNKANVSITIRSRNVFTTHNFDKKLGSIAILDKENRNLIGLGIVKTIKKDNF